MNTFDRRVYVERRKYNHIKKCWKLLQKNQTKLNSQKHLWCPVFRNYLTETDIVDRLLSYDLELHKGYTLYQHFLCAFKEKNFSHFHQLLLEDVSSLPENYQKTIQAFKKMSKKIKRSFERPYSNGPLECLNNHIKVLKRNAYGFRSFYNFKLKINLCFGEAHFKLSKKA